MSNVLGMRMYYESTKSSLSWRFWKKHKSLAEFYLKKCWEIPSLYFTLGCDDSERESFDLVFNFLWFSAYLILFPVPDRPNRKHWSEESYRWGFYFMGRTNLWLCWGKKFISWDIPFVSSVFVRSELMSLDRTRVVYVDSESNLGEWHEKYERKQELKKQNSLTYPYTYVCKNGEVQNDIKATVCIERFTRKRKWLPAEHYSDSINVHFDKEVGEKRGSWKGGCIGCYYTMEEYDTPLSCLFRMERERRFE